MFTKHKHFLVFLLLFGVFFFLPFVSLAQIGSTINGIVYGPGNAGLSDVDVELLDELSRLISRTRTTGGGRFVFRNLTKGSYVVRVIPGRLGYEEQSKGVELISFSRGSNAPTNDSQYVDFYLQSPKSVSLAESAGITNVVFVQEVPNDAEKLYKQALSDFDSNKADSGFEKLKKAVITFPTYYLALDRLGEEFIRRQDFKMAQIVLLEALKVNPKSASSLYMLGFSQYTAKNYSAAIESLRQSVVWSPKSANSYLYLGMALRKTGNFQEAETQMLKAKELAKKKLPDVHYQLALLYTNDLKKYSAAIEELELYLKVQRDSKEKEAVRKLIKQLQEKAGQ